MIIENILKNLNFDKFYRVGAVFSFLILFASLTVEMKVLTNSIIALYSLAFLLFFIGIWIGMVKEVIPHMGIIHHIEGHKKSTVGKRFYLASLIIFILAILQTIKFFFSF